jgi:hypothetical protein
MVTVDDYETIRRARRDGKSIRVFRKQGDTPCTPFLCFTATQPLRHPPPA